MADHRERAHRAMRQLWEKGNEYFEAHENEITSPYGAVETPGGLEISKVGDSLRIRGEFVKYIGGGICDVAIEIDFLPDMRDLPEVREDWHNEEEAAGSSTPAVRDFPKIVEEFLPLFNDFEGQQPTPRSIAG